MPPSSNESPFPVFPGTPYPLGATAMEDGSVNFAVCAPPEADVYLCLFTDTAQPNRETCRIHMPERRGDVRFLRVGRIPDRATYGYRVDGRWDIFSGRFFNSNKLLLDPYARRVDRISRFHPSLLSRGEREEPSTEDSGPYAPRAFVPTVDHYDWEGDVAPRTPLTETIVYEMHVKGFSKLNPALPKTLRGTYAGLAHPVSIQYLLDLGITAVQLMPIHHHLDDGFLLERELVNYWGYNTLAFFAPEVRYSLTSDPVTEFRDLVKALHRAGIEVILDVVYNHTCEAGVDGPTCLFRGFGNLCYYHQDSNRPGHYFDFTGCGNSVDLTHPWSLRLVMDSLRYWVEEMHVDGFRFDLAVELGRSTDSFSRRASFFQAVHQEPALAGVKLIAEPWDLGYGGYQIGNFPVDWSELNGKFRDAARRFWRGDPGASGEFAARIAGSEDLFAHNRRLPSASVNFVTSHDGFTLLDLVSHNQRHNLANGERNADGDSNNLSYNHGVEGPTNAPEIRTLRLRQIRNFLTTLFCSRGVPFLLAGDERLRTQGGNNNGYCQDNETSWLSWREDHETLTMRNFVKKLIKLRRDTACLRKDDFYKGSSEFENGSPDIIWLRTDGSVKVSSDWDVDGPGLFAVLINGTEGGESLLFFFNAGNEDHTFQFPPDHPAMWSLAVNTVEPEASGTRLTAPQTILVTRKSVQIWRQAAVALPSSLRTSRPAVQKRSSRRGSPSIRIQRARKRIRKNVARGFPGRGAGARRPSSE